MFTYIISTRLKLKSEEAKIAMVIFAMFIDFWFIMIILEGFGIIGGK